MADELTYPRPMRGTPEWNALPFETRKAWDLKERAEAIEECESYSSAQERKNGHTARCWASYNALNFREA